MCVTVLAACGRNGAVSDVNDAPRMRPAEQGGSSAVYFTVRNAGTEPLVLYDAEIDVAGNTTIHQSMDADDMATMTRLDSVVVPAGKTVRFAERGLHLMAAGLRAALVAGDTVVVRLLFRPARVDTLRVPVRE
jgi:periplasmic copper chaperone A